MVCTTYSSWRYYAVYFSQLQGYVLLSSTRLCFLPGVESVLSVASGGVCVTYFPQYCLCLAIWVELRTKNNRTNVFRDNHFHHIANIIMVCFYTIHITVYKYNLVENENCLCLHRELTQTKVCLHNKSE